MQIYHTEIDKAFSDALVKLLSEGYMLTPTYKNGRVGKFSKKWGRDRYCGLVKE